MSKFKATLSSQLPIAADSTSRSYCSSAAGIGDKFNLISMKIRAPIVYVACRAQKVRCNVVSRSYMTGKGEATCSRCIMET